jgi:hypothetical protein
LGDETTPASDFSTSAFEANPTSGSVSESNGTLTFNNSTSSGTQVQLKNRDISDDNTYKITFTLSNFTSGSFRMSVGNQLTDTINYNDVGAEGTHTFFVTKTGGSARNYFYTGGTSVVVSNISVKEVSHWNLGTGWSIEDGVATCDGTQSPSTSYLSHTLSSTTTPNNIYKVTYTLTIDDGNLEAQLSGGGSSAEGESRTTSDTYTEYITAEQEHTTFRFRANSSFEGTVDNVSVKDVTFSDDVDLARINYDSNGENGHILLEPTSTNLVTYSEDIDSLDNGVGEVGVDSTLTYESDVVAPDGSLGVYRIQMPATSGTYLKVTGSVVAQSMSVWVKAKTVGTNNQFTLYRDDASDIKTATGDWQRFEHSWSNNNSGTYYINNDGDTYTSDLYVWGIQVENLPYTTSYIPTLTGSTVTRATETLNGSGNSTLINSTEGVLYAEIAALANSNTVRYLGLNDGSSNNRVVILNDGTANRIRAIVSSGGTKYADLYYNVTDVTDFHKVAVKYKANDFALWIDGVERAIDTSGSAPIGLNDLDFELSGGNFYGKCKALAVFNEALSDTELTNLTS